MHLDTDYAGATRFGGRIAHGMLSASLISAVIGTKLPGPGCIYMSQSLKFRAPVKPGDTVKARVKITAIDATKRRATLACTCHVGDTLVIDGEALVMVPSKGDKS
jgi:3-hydroxybutyryl-CoA dehydratase